MSSLIRQNLVLTVGKIVDDGNNFIVNDDLIFPKSGLENAFVVDAEPSGTSATGWMYVNNSFVAVPSVDEDFDEAGANAIRRQRNDKLLASDWTQVADSASRCDQAAWATYRQQLCDITKQTGFPKKVVWPTNPNGVI